LKNSISGILSLGHTKVVMVDMGINVVEGSSTYIDLEWYQNREVPVPIETYNIYLNGVLVDSITSTSQYFGDLLSGTDYLIRIDAINSEGVIIGDITELVTTETLASISGFTSTEVTSSLISVTWDSFFSGEDTGTYRIELDGVKLIDLAQSDSEYTLIELAPDTEYILRITAWYTGSDDASAEAILTITTAVLDPL
jgi:hypothetical protein